MALILRLRTTVARQTSSEMSQTRSMTPQTPCGSDTYRADRRRDPTPINTYTAFLDLAQGLASPALGLIAAGLSLNVVFIVSAGTVLCATLVASWLMAHPTAFEGTIK
jgi:hypothetical protein